MCGRYATTQTPDSINAEFEIAVANSLTATEPDYNVAPTVSAPIVVERIPAHSPAPERHLKQARWGLVPSWAKDLSIGNKMINARSETVAEKPAYKRAFATRRALIPADGYFEWYATAEVDRRGKPVKQPFFIRPRDGRVLVMAGLYELWRDPGDDSWVWSYTIITTSAEDSLGHIHDRMPLMVERDAYAEWLDPSPRPAGQLLDLLAPAAPGALEAFAVSTAVNNVRNNSASLIEPLDAD